MGAFIFCVIFLCLLIFITSCSGDGTTQSVEDVGDGDNIEPINYTLHSTGNSNINTTPYGGIVLMGGSSDCLLYTSPSPRDKRQSRMPSSA